MAANRRFVLWAVVAALGALGGSACDSGPASPRGDAPPARGGVVSGGATDSGAGAAPGGDPSELPASRPRSTPYGDPPEGAAPFARFHPAEKRFFVDSLAYTGAGREHPAPEAPETVRLGMLVPLGSPRDGVYGHAIVNGGKLAVDEFNADGGYRGLPFEMIVRNDNGLWGASANEIVRFAYEDEVRLFFGTIDGANSHIALRVALKAELPMVNVAATDPTLTETRIPWLVRAMVDDRAQAYVLAEHVFAERGRRRVVALRGNERYGRMGIAEFRDTARRMGHSLLLERNIIAGATNFDEALDAAVRFRPDAFVLWLDPWEAAGVVKAIRARGWTMPIFGSSRAVRPELLQLAGAAAEGFTGVTSFDPTSQDERTRSFVARYEQAYGVPPDDFAATSYDSMVVVLEAIREAGLNRARIRDALNKRRVWHGVRGESRLNEVLNATTPVFLSVVEDGRFSYRKVR